jgi:hypothetical protein
MEVAERLIQTLGFPIFIALYFITYLLPRKLDRFYTEQNRTNVLLAVLVKVLTTDKDGPGIPIAVVEEASGVVDVPEEES